MEKVYIENKEVEANIYNFRKWVDETSPTRLYTLLNEALQKVGYTILKHIEHHFPVKGYTCLWLLAESHLAVHTFPEENKAYIELSGCNKRMNEEFEGVVDDMFEETFVGDK